MKRKLKLYLVIIPLDYRIADVSVFETKEEAHDFLGELVGDKRHYSFIREEEITVHFKKR